MKKGLLAALLGGMLACVLVTPAAVADSSVARFKTDGYMFADFGNCPDVPEPPAGTVCTETHIEVFREAVAVGGGSVAGPKTPWSAFLSKATLTFGPDGDFVVSDERIGFLPVIDPADVTYDQQHLAFASLKAEIPWEDGGTSSVDFTWEAISDRFLYGNDGPTLDEFGLARKFVV